MSGAIGYNRTVAWLVAFRSAAWGLMLFALAFTWVIAECSWRLIEAQASRIRHGLAPDTPKSLELCGAGCGFKASGAPQRFLGLPAHPERHRHQALQLN